MSSVAEGARANHLPSEQGGPSGEGMSSNATSVPQLLQEGMAQGNCPRAPQSTQVMVW